MPARRARAPRPATLAVLANVGPATLADFRTLRISSVAQLATKDPVKLYSELCRRTGQRHDPCVIDVFMSAVDQANGGAPVPWWEFTPLRKKLTTASAAVARAGASRKRPTRAASARTR